MEIREKPSPPSPEAMQHPLAAFVLQGSEGSAAALRRGVHGDASRLDVGAQLLVGSLHGRMTDRMERGEVQGLHGCTADDQAHHQLQSSPQTALTCNHDAVSE